MNDRKIDQMLIEHTQQGGQKMFEILMSKYQHRLFRLIIRFVGDEHDVNDIAQEAMIRAYCALSGFRGENVFYIWLYRIAINTAKNFLITSEEQLFVSAEVAGEEGDILDLSDQMADYRTSEAEMVSRGILQTIGAAISKLPDDLRKAITLREMDGSSYEEVTQVMGCPIGTVCSRIFRTRKVVAKDLRPLLDTSED